MRKVINPIIDLALKCKAFCEGGKKTAILAGGILGIALLFILFTTLRRSKEGTKPVAKEISPPLTSAVVNPIRNSISNGSKEEPKEEGEGGEEVKEEAKQVEAQEKEEAEHVRVLSTGRPLVLQAKEKTEEEKTEEELLTLNRDPFSFLAKKVSPGGELETFTVAPGEIGLDGIIYDPPNSRVIIHDQILREGDEVDGKRIEKIEPDRVILFDTDGRRKLICPLEEVEGKR